MSHRYLVALVAIVFSLGAAAQADLSSARTKRDLIEAGYQPFDSVSGLAFYEALTGRKIPDEQYVNSRDALQGVTDTQLIRLYNDARGSNEFVARSARQQLAPVIEGWRRDAAEAKGVLLHISSTMGVYDFNRQAFPMEGVPTGGPAQKNFPGGLICSDAVDLLAPVGRSFCVYLNNFNGGGKYQLPVGDESLAQWLKAQWERRAVRVYLLAHFDGPVQVAQPRTAAAATQAVRVTDLYVIDDGGRIVLSAPVNEPRLAGLSAAPALSAAGATRQATAAPAPKPAQLNAVPLKAISRPSNPVQATKKPVIVDVRP